MKCFSKFIQKLIRWSTHHYQSIHEVPRLQLQQFLRYFADKIAAIFFQRAITQERGLILSRNKLCVSYFFKGNPFKKFQNSSMHGSKIMPWIKKRDKGTDG